MKKLIVLIAMTLVVIGVYSQQPQQNPPNQQGPRGGIFVVADVNKDGKVTKEEWVTFFEKVDKNKDGVLTQDELRAVMQRGPQGQGPRGQGNGSKGPPPQK